MRLRRRARRGAAAPLRAGVRLHGGDRDARGRAARGRRGGRRGAPRPRPGADGRHSRAPADARGRLRRGLRHAAGRHRRLGRAALPPRPRPSLTRRRVHERRPTQPTRRPRRELPACRGLRPRVSRLRGRENRTLGTARRDLAGRDPHLARPRARRRREGRAVALARARARPDGRARRRGRVRRPGDEPGRLRASVVRGLLRVRDGAARPLRGGRRAAPDLPRSKRPRALAVRRAADHAARLRRRAVGLLRDGPPGGGVDAGGRALHVERPRREEPRLVPPGQLGRRAAVPRRRRPHRRCVDDPRAPRCVVRDATRVRVGGDARGDLHRFRDRRHRRGELLRGRRGRGLARRASAGDDGRGALDLR